MAGLVCAFGHIQGAGDVKQAAQKGLYLHWCIPTYYVAGKNETKPPSRILSTRVFVGQEISITLDNGSPSLHGRIDLRDGKYSAKLTGSFGTSSGSFSGVIQPEKAFEPDLYAFSSAICGTYFVLSTDKSCKPFLKAKASSKAGD